MKQITRMMSVLLAMSLLLCACTGEEARKVDIDPNVVWIYDVESQDRSHISKEAYDKYLEASANMANASAQQLVAAYDEFHFDTHEYRMGIFTAIANDKQAPFISLCKEVEEESGISVEYIVMDNWEEVRADIEKNKNNGITKIVLFNNSYDESIYKEVTSGTYANLEHAMEEGGLYDAETYDQAVIQAGRIDGEQYLIPVLYNVTGMIHGEMAYNEEGTGYKRTEADYKKESLSFEAFLQKLIDAMKENNLESEEYTFISTGFYENSPDLFLLASGIEWADYQNQEELFTLLMEYVKTYQEYQTSEHDGLSDQDLMIMYQETHQRASVSDEEGDAVLEDLKIKDSIFSYEVQTRTKYFVECSTNEDIAFHSIVGLLSYSGIWCYSGNSTDTTVDSEYGMMEYWPVGMMGEADAYAAQPISYAAVVDDGGNELAVKVISHLLQQKVKAKYGLSPCIATREWQFEDWNTLQGRNAYGVSVRDIQYDMLNQQYNLTDISVHWDHNRIDGNGDKIAQQVASEQLQEQLANVATAQIPDREAMSIWQDTLAEAVESGLSAEAGFELLCERMDEWYE